MSCRRQRGSRYEGRRAHGARGRERGSERIRAGLVCGAGRRRVLASGRCEPSGVSGALDARAREWRAGSARAVRERGAGRPPEGHFESPRAVDARKRERPRTTPRTDRATIDCMLETGTKAPDFTLPDQDGNAVDRAELPGRRSSCTSIPRPTRRSTFAVRVRAETGRLMPALISGGRSSAVPRR